MQSDIDAIDRLTVANPDQQPTDRAPRGRKRPMCTAHTPFSSIPVLGEGVNLFAVQEGVRADFAIQMAGAQLNAGLNAMRDALCDQAYTPESASLWSAFYCIEGAAAVVGALALTVEAAVGDDEEEQQQEVAA
jgi:hypothetical protein